MASRLDKNTLIPLGFAIVIAGGSISIAYFAGGFFERLSKFDPVRLEVRLSSIETQVENLNKRFDRIERQKAELVFPFPSQYIANKSTTPETERKDAKDDPRNVRHGNSIRLLTR